MIDNVLVDESVQSTIKIFKEAFTQYEWQNDLVLNRLCPLAELEDETPSEWDTTKFNDELARLMGDVRDMVKIRTVIPEKLTKDFDRNLGTRYVAMLPVAVANKIEIEGTVAIDMAKQLLVNNIIDDPLL